MAAAVIKLRLKSAKDLTIFEDKLEFLEAKTKLGMTEITSLLMVDRFQVGAVQKRPNDLDVVKELLSVNENQTSKPRARIDLKKGLARIGAQDLSENLRPTQEMLDMVPNF